MIPRCRFRFDTKLRSSEYQKKLKSSGSFAPRTPSQLRCSVWRRRRPSRCWATAAGAERLAARVCARGQILRGAGIFRVKNHFPALFDYFNLERNSV